MAEVSETLRPHLQLDFSYTQARSEPEKCSVSSFVAEFSKSGPEADILCLAPVETAADKFSALLWRVNKRNRDDAQDDPAMIRHLHDLHALKDCIHSQDKEFKERVSTSFNEDEHKPSRSMGMTLPGAIEQMLDKLNRDEVYKTEYERFVSRMSYAELQDLASFNDAMDFLKELSESVESGSIFSCR